MDPADTEKERKTEGLLKRTRGAVKERRTLSSVGRGRERAIKVGPKWRDKRNVEIQEAKQASPQ